jgi:hypothetical protein
MNAFWDHARRILFVTIENESEGFDKGKLAEALGKLAKWSVSQITSWLACSFFLRSGSCQKMRRRTF